MFSIPEYPSQKQFEKDLSGSFFYARVLLCFSNANACLCYQLPSPIQTLFAGSMARMFYCDLARQYDFFIMRLNELCFDKRNKLFAHHNLFLMPTSTASPGLFIDRVKDLARTERNVNNCIRSCRQNYTSNKLQPLLEDYATYEATHSKRAQDSLTLLNLSSWDGDQAFVQNQISPLINATISGTNKDIPDQKLLDSLQQLTSKLITHYNQICEIGAEVGYIVVADVLSKNKRDKEILQERISKLQEHTLSLQKDRMRSGHFHTTSL
ncbi:MAG: hypothetical protein BRD50_00185 [Bacteroidetes bacterium SW_11_45_7]|nr:MAG: hypothetical protein BRD50_00185 [Bacteroidetes bacterium SW_11_45_7]